LQSTDTIRLNKLHHLIDQVLSGRYRCQLAEGSGNGYLRRQPGSARNMIR
jgi:hypothetical protein